MFAVDRGGIVGDDGKTHQGIFDISYLSMIPDLIVASPRDENEMQHLLYTAVACGRPMAVRYPRSAGLGVHMDEDLKELPIGKAEVLRQGTDTMLLAIGSMVAPSLKASDLLKAQGIDAGVIDLRYAKPLDATLPRCIGPSVKCLVTLEENVLSGGVGCSVNSLLQKTLPVGIPVYNIGIPDKFIEHGPQDVLRARYRLDADGIAASVKVFLSSDSQAAGLKSGIEIARD